MYHSLVGKNTKRIIKEKKLFQYKVAEQIGLHPKVFNAMLNNRRTISDQEIILIARALQVEPNELFRE